MLTETEKQLIVYYHANKWWWPAQCNYLGSHH
jgi:hypothetical protein